MKKLAAVIVLAIFGALVPLSAAQEKPKTEEKTRQVTPLKIQVVITEFDGDRKVSSLPYSFSVNAPSGTASIRMGVRVPVVTGGKDGTKQVQYMDVGTNLDCRARSPEDGRYELDLTVERSSVYSGAAKNDARTAPPASDEVQVSTEQPLIKQFRTGLTLLLKDGQTAESVTSTDPLSGRVLRVSVTLNVVK